MTARSTSRRWAADNPGNVAIRAEVGERVRTRCGDALRTGPVLDIGCGTGYWLAWAAAQGCPTGRLAGIDIDPGRADAARRRVPGADVRSGDAAALPWPDGRFALALLFLVLSSIPARADRAAVLREATRVLAPGGRLVVWDTRVANPLNRSTRVVGMDELRTAGQLTACEPVTLLPALARRLGSRTDPWYGRLARAPALRTHRLVVIERRPSQP